ncbi:MAG: GHKL domain-containing protein [Bacteroidales bacterium]|nr:GHKL domain-containing protein [Bacteroidales bacterium]
MMKIKGETKRQRIIIGYALAIVLPCLILGFLALRGIKNDQALVEREQRSKILETGKQIISETDAYILSTENSFSEITGSIAVPEKRIFKDSLLYNFSRRLRAVAGIFYLSGTGLPYLLNNNLLYVPDDLLSASDVVNTHSIEKILENGWQVEFMENNYREAVRYYQNALRGITGKQPQGEILNIIARLQKKLKLDDEAIKTYDLIWNDYPEVLIQNTIPLGAVALLEKSLICLGNKDSIAALKTAHLLLIQLLKPRWEMGYSHFSIFLSKINEIISACENSGDEEIKSLLERIHTLEESISLSTKHTEYILAFLQGGEIMAENMNQGTEVKNHRYKSLISGKSYLISLFPANDDGQWGLIMDQDDILNSSVYHSILTNAGASKFCWEVTNINGELLLKSEDIPEDIQSVHVMFPPELPSWSLILYPVSSGLFTSLFHRGAGIFLYIFIAIVIILAFGLIFTLQSVNNEMRLSKMKSYFMSTVSHEFKSPLTSIRQMAEMLVDGRVSSPERQLKYHTSILQQSERLSHLIDNILDFSKMEEGQKIFQFEKADITLVVKDIVESFQYHKAGQGFDISLSIPGLVPDIVFDREAMEQVMHNLLDNACKYSGDSRKIEVHLLSKVNEIIISVRDYGAGIRKEDQDKIFSRFYRAGEELTQTVKGSGIGLTIVKQIVEAHNGHITVESSPGKGSTFSVRLPVS